MKALPWILCIVLLGVLGWQHFGRIPSRHGDGVGHYSHL